MSDENEVLKVSKPMEDSIKLSSNTVVKTSNVMDKLRSNIMVDDFKALRHRYYKLGKGRERILKEMGYLLGLLGDTPTKEEEKAILVQIWETRRMPSLVWRIEEMEAAQRVARDLEKKLP